MYVTKTVSAANTRKKTSFFCERVRVTGATALDMVPPRKWQ
jgi:hypothetical protein